LKTVLPIATLFTVVIVLFSTIPANAVTYTTTIQGSNMEQCGPSDYCAQIPMTLGFTSYNSYNITVNPTDLSTITNISVSYMAWDSNNVTDREADNLWLVYANSTSYWSSPKTSPMLISTGIADTMQIRIVSGYECDIQPVDCLGFYTLSAVGTYTGTANTLAEIVSTADASVGQLTGLYGGYLYIVVTSAAQPSGHIDVVYTPPAVNDTAYLAYYNNYLLLAIIPILLLLKLLKKV
jgi:hypothetical protein